MRRLWNYFLITAALLTTGPAVQAADNLQLTLPPAIYAVPGMTTEIFFDNIVLKESIDGLRFSVDFAAGAADAKRWSWTPTATDVGTHALSVTVRDADSSVVEEASTVVHVISPLSGSELKNEPKLLIIGDSLTHASTYPNRIAALLSQDGNPNWSMLGTHKPKGVADGVAHEGYGGWTWARFVSHYEPNPDGTYRKRSSPFVFLNEQTQKPEFDLPRYFKESCNNERPDYVVIMLGINDCFGAPADDIAGIDAVIDRVFANADKLLAAIRSAAPKAEIGFCLTTPPNARQEAFQANYKDRYTRWGWKRIQHRLVQRQLKYVAEKQDSHITIVPTQLNVDPVDGYPHNNSVHPNTAGYNQIGDTIYAWLKWRLADAGAVASMPISNTEDVFLLPYFLGNGEAGVRFAFSQDGRKFDWLNGGDVVMPAPAWDAESLTRDPSLLYHGGIFHMVWTTSWKSRTIGYASSEDLLVWTEPQKFDVWGSRGGVNNTWAPELHWDPEQQEYLVLFSTTTDQELHDNDGSADSHGHDHRTYAVTTKDFRTWTAPQLFFSPQDPEYGVIDPFIAHDDCNTAYTADDRWVMVIKNEMPAAQGGKNLRLTFSNKMQGPYNTTLTAPVVGMGTDIVNQMGEGPSLFKRNSLWHLYWDAPGSQFSYCLATSPDLKSWTNRSAEMSLPAKQMRHGTVVVVPRTAVAEALQTVSTEDAVKK